MCTVSLPSSIFPSTLVRIYSLELSRHKLLWGPPKKGFPLPLLVLLGLANEKLQVRGTNNKL